MDPGSINAYIKRKKNPAGYDKTKTFTVDIFLLTKPPKKSAVPHMRLEIKAKKADMFFNLSFLSGKINFVALNLHDELLTKLNIETIKKALQNIDLQKKRISHLKVENFSVEDNSENKVVVRKVLDLDIPPSAKSMVNNPFTLLEVWNLEYKDSIFLNLEISKIQTNIDCEIKQGLANQLKITTTIKSNVFLMSSFVEEHVSKIWKKLIIKDLATIEEWVNLNQN